MITATTTVQDLLTIAINKLDEFPSGEVFIVRDLFCGVDWNRVPMGTRIKLGSMFLDYVSNPNNKPLLEKLEKKTPQNQQRYKKQ